MRIQAQSIIESDQNHERIRDRHIESQNENQRRYSMKQAKSKKKLRQKSHIYVSQKEILCILVNAS